MGFRYISKIEVPHGMMSIPMSVALMVMNPYILMHIKEYPVFKPNEYFWENHWQKDKEEKWEAYARAIRSIIATTFDFKLCDFSGEDKMEFKRQVFGYKKKKVDANKKTQ